MKDIKKVIPNSKIPEGNDIGSNKNDNSGDQKAPVWPEEFEEQRSMNIRMNEQPLQASPKPVKKKGQK